MSISDDLMVRYYELLSDMSLSELENLKSGLNDRSLHPMTAKKALGKEIVSRYHGHGAGEAAEENFVKRFKDNGIPDEMPQVVFSLKKSTLVLARSMSEDGLTKSNGEGRRSIEGGGVSLNGEKVSDTNLELSAAGEYIVQIGKRRFARIIVNR